MIYHISHRQLIIFTFSDLLGAEGGEGGKQVAFFTLRAAHSSNEDVGAFETGVAF